MSSNTRKLLWEESSDFLANSLDHSESSVDGYFVGEVVANNDPEKIGRCRVRVIGLHDKIDNNDLPWATPEFTFVGSKKGNFIVPPVGCYVRIYFQDSDIYFPVYSRKVIDKSNLPKNKNKNYPNNMIFFETDLGTSLEINRTNDETKLIHKSGTELRIDSDGTVHVKTHKIVDDNALTAIVPPAPRGHFNCIQICPFTGIPHNNNVAGF